MNRINKLAALSIVAILLITLQSSAFAQNVFQIIAHSISAEPIEGQVAYNVQVFLSVLESEGTPVKDLDLGSFSLSEDSQPVTLESVTPVTNEAISVILVMDASGSMSGQAIIDARNAASGFLERMGSDDQSAVISFNDTVTTQSTFSNNHQASSNAIQQITAVNLAGTCLYDAAYQAVELASTTPPGRRAIILFTDGVDETAKGDRCSYHIIDDVINLSKSTGTPIFTLGMGNSIDEKELQRMAANTGGTFLASRNSTELDAVFTKLYEQLNNQYILSYISKGAPGPHSLTVAVDYRSQTDQSTLAFNLPALPTTITFNAPADGETVTGVVPLKAKLLTQGSAVASVEFAVNGVVIGKDISEPYEINWDTSVEFPGEAVLEVVAMSKDGAELARSALNVTIEETETEALADETGETEATPIIDENKEPETEANFINQLTSNKQVFIYLGIGAALLAILIAVIVVSQRRKRQNEANVVDEFKPRKTILNEGVTIDELDVSGLRNMAHSDAPLATLTVQASDDPASIGHQYQITRVPVVMGRGAEADLLFSSKDQAISRRHAMLDQHGTQLVLSDIGSKYGTYLNDKQVGGSPAVLKTGDIIRLGSRTRLLFEQASQMRGSNDETAEDINLSDLSGEYTNESI